MEEEKSQNKRTYKNIITETVIDGIDKIDSKEYVNELRKRINIKQYPLKLKIILTSEFNSPISLNTIKVHYSHPIQIILTENNLNEFFNDLLDKLNAWIDGFQEKGSGFVFKNIISSIIKQYEYKFQKASSYIPLQFRSSNIINVKNEKDNKCFLWSILAKLYPANDHKQRVSNYKPYEDKINMNGIDYPVKIKDISKVENQNENLSINVFALEKQEDKKTIYPVYISNKNNKEKITIDLLFIESNENTHYCLIKDLDSFKYDKNNHKQYTCRNCMQAFQKETTLKNHKEICLDNKHCNIILPKKDKNILKFHNHHFKEKLPFSIYCDFEANNIPIETTQPNPNESYTNKIFKQEVNSYGIYVKSAYPDIFKSQYFSYIGNDAKEKFVKKILSIYKKITYETYKRKDNKPILSKQEEEEFQKATHCYICGAKFSTICEKEHKIREHNHFTGVYRGAACQSCNTKEGKSSKLIPVFFHNGSNYDFHFIIEELKKNEDDYNKVSVLSKSSEEYISIEYGSNYQKLRFLDSYRFLSKGLSDVAKSLKEFPILESQFEETSLLKQKGFYPYEYIDSIEKLNETELPNISKFYSTLKQEGISEEDYNHVKKVWDYYNCKNLKDYHNLYLKTDVLILADAFEQFRNFFLKHHEIDPCYCFSAPGLTWQCGLKFTGVELELLTDYDMLLMFENGIRGGYSGVLGSRHVKAFNKYTPNYKNGNRILDDNELKECIEKIKNGENLNDLLKEKFLLYLDANNLYGHAMSQPLPTGDFKWEEEENYYKNIPKGRGCIVECDLEYPDSCKFKTKRFPLAPEHMVVKEEMLSEYQRNLMKKLNIKLGKEKKLFLTLYDKKKYIVHHSILKEYIKLGLKVTKVHRTISFKESAWLKPYIDFNTEQRKKAKSDFEKDQWKLMNNAFYGKTMENIRNRSDIKLLSDENEVKKYINKPNFKDSIIFNENLVAIVNNITSIKFDKPIYLGQAILDYSKQLMYQFYYEVINKLWPENEIIGFDTDSFFLNIYTEDLYKDLEQIKDELDTSDYPKDHPLYSEKNKKVIGKFKDELAGKIMNEIVFLKSKAYSYNFIDSTSNNDFEKEEELSQAELIEKKKLKGISQSIVKKEINLGDYKNCLYNIELKLNNMFILNSINHEMFINELLKISLNPFDDKRYIYEDGIITDPYGLESLYFT